MIGIGVQWWVGCGAGEDCERTHVVGADRVRRHPLEAGEAGHGASARITCPECGLSSPNARDREEGYCGNCHWWTSVAELGAARREEFAADRALADRYFAERTALGLRQDGTPQDAIERLRRRYVADVLGSSAARAQLAAWAASSPPAG